MHNRRANILAHDRILICGSGCSASKEGAKETQKVQREGEPCEQQRRASEATQGAPAGRWCPRKAAFASCKCPEHFACTFDRSRKFLRILESLHDIPAFVDVLEYARIATHNWHTRNRVASDSMPVCLRGQLMGRQSIASASVSDRWRGIWWLRDAQAYQVRYAFQTWNTTIRRRQSGRDGIGVTFPDRF